MEVRGRTETSINEAESLHQKHGNPTRGAALSRWPMWITRPAIVDNYRQSLLAVCGCPVDGVGTSDAPADGAWMQTSDPSTPGHTLYQRFCFQQVLEPKAIFELSTERARLYLLLLSVYIKKKVNPSIDLRRSYRRANTPGTSRCLQQPADVMGPPRNASPMRVYGTRSRYVVTKLTCRRQSHAGIMSPLEPPGGSDVCVIYS